MRYDDRPDPLIALHSGAVARSRDSFARWLDEPRDEPEKKDDTVRWVDPQLAGVASDLKHPAAPQTPVVATVADDWFAVGKLVDVPSFGISGKLTRLEGRHAVVTTDAGNGESMTYYVFREQCRPAVSPAVRYLEDDRQMREACL